MTINYKKNTTNLKTQALIVGVAQGKLNLLPIHILDLIPESVKQEFSGEAGQLKIVFVNSPLERIVLAGLGKKFNLEATRRILGKAISSLDKAVSKVGLYATGLEDYLEDLLVISLISNYQYSHKKNKQVKELTEIVIVADKEPSQDVFKRSAAVANGVVIARDLANAPSNLMTPKSLAAAAKKVAKEIAGLSCKIKGLPELTKENFGALLAVSQGSHQEPQLIEMSYKHPQAKRRIALVGKGVTFDSGGINIKPTPGMEEMKIDMAGGAVVVGVMAAIAQLDLPLEVIGIVPATENMPSGAAIKPSDIVRSRSGLTVEVANTDAEGQMILADGLDYAKEFKPDEIIDLATLTGAALVAFGHERAALVGNNKKLNQLMIDAGERSGEGVWQLPLDNDYRTHVKSEIADVKNLGEGRNAGVIAGAAFLEKFIPKDTPWAHLDIAGPAIKSKPRSYESRGGTGWGVRLLVEYLKSLN